jgi:hypothetical protein
MEKIMAKQRLTEIELKVQNHKPTELNYAYQKAVSYSQYSIYRKCPHQWYLNYVKGLATYEQSIHTIFGTAIHEAMQHYLKVLYEVSGAEADREDITAVFKETFKTLYKEEFNRTKTHFSSPDEMAEFYEDGIEILNYFKKNRRKYFSTRNVVLLGIEMPLMVGLSKNLFIKGYIDFVLYDKDLDKVYIYDIKTSRQGWKNKEKKDDVKIAQILLYKEFFAKQYNIDIDKIEVQFFIVKRKLWDNDDFIIPRAQMFKPAAGKTKRKQAMELFNSFLNECFDNEGKHIDKDYLKIVGKNSCMYCPFSNNKELCDKNIVS